MHNKVVGGVGRGGVGWGGVVQSDIYRGGKCSWKYGRRAWATAGTFSVESGELCLTGCTEPVGKELYVEHDLATSRAAGASWHLAGTNRGSL